MASLWCAFSYMTWGNLTVLYADSFYNLSKLHTLDLTANNLTSIPSKLITLSNSWKALDFTANNLTTVPSGIQDVVASGYVYVTVVRFVLFDLICTNRVLAWYDAVRLTGT